MKYTGVAGHYIWLPTTKEVGQHYRLLKCLILTIEPLGECCIKYVMPWMKEIPSTFYLILLKWMMLIYEHYAPILMAEEQIKQKWPLLYQLMKKEILYMFA